MDGQKVKGIAGIATEEVDTYLVALWGCETCFGWCETLHSAERPSKAEKEEPLSTCTGHGMFFAPGKGYSGDKSKRNHTDPTSEVVF